MRAIVTRQEMIQYLTEDDVFKSPYYHQQLPMDIVDCRLLLKSTALIAGSSVFNQVFETLIEEQLTGREKSYWLDSWSDQSEQWASECEGEFRQVEIGRPQVLFECKLPMKIAISGERLALNLIAHASKIATLTHHCAEKASKEGITILDTRKTTPGLRQLEKYAVRIGGGANHRMGQTDVWMIKDNHKNFFGGVRGAVNFFRDLGAFYTPIVLEVHAWSELQEGIDLGIQHFLLDHFSREQVVEAVELKNDFPFITLELSGGVTFENLQNFLIPGVDALSLGQLTYGAPPVDFSFKMKQEN